jgi:hypothetical protein
VSCKGEVLRDSRSLLVICRPCKETIIMRKNGSFLNYSLYLLNDQNTMKIKMSMVQG